MIDPQQAREHVYPLRITGFGFSSDAIGGEVHNRMALTVKYSIRMLLSLNNQNYL